MFGGETSWPRRRRRDCLRQVAGLLPRPGAGRRLQMGPVCRGTFYKAPPSSQRWNSYSQAIPFPYRASKRRGLPCAPWRWHMNLSRKRPFSQNHERGLPSRPAVCCEVCTSCDTGVPRRDVMRLDTERKHTQWQVAQTLNTAQCLQHPACWREPFAALLSGQRRTLNGSCPTSTPTPQPFVQPSHWTARLSPMPVCIDSNPISSAKA